MPNWTDSADPSPRWYMIHTYSGFEEKVKLNIQQRIESMDMAEEILDVVVPIETVVERKGGKKNFVPVKFLPGYVMVLMILNEETWHFIKTTDKVSGFVGSGSSPSAISEAEVENVFARMKEGAAKPKHKVSFDKGESVRIMEGPFANFTGLVDDVNEEKGRLRVLVSIFGRSTPVELDFLQVEKV